MNRVAVATRVALTMALAAASGCTPPPNPSPDVPRRSLEAPTKDTLAAAFGGFRPGSMTRDGVVHLEQGVRVPVAMFVPVRDRLRITSEARVTSTDPSLVRINTGFLHTLRPGRVRIQVERWWSFDVEVMTHRQAVNRRITETCLNENEQELNSRTPIQTEVSTIHEYSDCQRLIADGDYGPLVGIFAVKGLETLGDWSTLKGGYLAAVIVNFGGKGNAHTYAPLELPPGTSCLVLKADDADRWQAAVIPQKEPWDTHPNHTYGSCDNALTWNDVPGTAKHYTVKTQHGVDINSYPLVPPTARWDWDPQNQTNYFGVKCDVATWCEIGATGQVSAPRLIGTQQLIKGYYDEQLLAQAGGQKPSAVLGTVVPAHQPLGHPWTNPHHTLDMYFSAPANATSAQDDHAFYIRKFMATASPYYPGAPYRGRGELSLLSIPSTYNFDVTVDGHGDAKWSMRYYAHPGHKMYAIARWRWEANDETTWETCPPDGCCEHMGTAVQ